MTFRKFLLIIFSTTILMSCNTNESKNKSELELKMNDIAKEYVKVVLRVGQIDTDFVDAYYGPENLIPHDELKTAEDSTKLITQCNSKIDQLLDGLDSLKDFKADQLETLRYKFLYKQLLAVKTKLFMIQGGTFTFDKESEALYDAVAPVNSKEYFQSILNELDKVLPGKGNISKRLEDYKKHFIIPKEKLQAVFTAAINECKKRTSKYLTLPVNENFSLEYVTNKPWSGYNWYKGNYYSIIQVNTDLPIYIERAIDLAAHEGYPGHHVYNCLLENNLVNDKGWVEFTVYPLFSPQSLIAEGTANFGIQMIFPGDEKIQFEKNILFPLAGLDTSKAEEYNNIIDLASELKFSENEAARNFLDGKWDKKESVNWLFHYSLLPQDRAEQRLRFIEKYRSYVINYNLGEEIIKNYLEKKDAAKNNPEKKWELFKYLLTTPQTPSELIFARNKF